MSSQIIPLLRAKTIKYLPVVRTLASKRKPPYISENKLRINEIESEAVQHDLLLQQYHLKVMDSQQVLVIQPWYHHTLPFATTDTTEDLKMAETLGLVKTLNWRVVDAIILRIMESVKPAYFGTGQLDRVKELIEMHETQKGHFISSVFVSTYRLTSMQRVLMEEIIEKPVIDRYNVILQIFHKHARTSEAKLQVQMAEIPFLKSRLLGDWDVENESKHSKQRRGKEWFERQQKALNKREKKIKMALEKLKAQRSLIRCNRQKTTLPSIAVVGYTNCGKTSLIKALTGTEKLEPRDELFATLDVTSHKLTFPSQLEGFFLDTVGFISDIPINLIASFNATLEDAASADLIIHVRDVSNPDHVMQSKQVIKTLKRLNLPEKLVNSMITVGNKIDKIPPDDWKFIEEEGMIPISTKTGENMEKLLNTLDSTLIRETNRVFATLRLPTGSPEFFALMQNEIISSLDTCDVDSNFSLVKTILLEYQLSKYKQWIVA